MNKKFFKYFRIKIAIVFVIVFAVGLFLYFERGSVLSDRIIRDSSRSAGLNFQNNLNNPNFSKPIRITGSKTQIENYNYREFTMPPEGTINEPRLMRSNYSGMCYFFANPNSGQKRRIGNSTYDFYENVSFNSKNSNENSQKWKVIAQTSGPKISGGEEKCGVLLFRQNQNPFNLIKVNSPNKNVRVMEKDIQVLNKKVLQVVYNPIFNGTSLISKYNFKNPNTLTQNHILFFREVSQRTLNFSVVSRINFNKFPPNKNKVYFDEKSYDDCYKRNTNCLNLGEADYLEMLRETKACELLNEGKIDEVWVYSPPLTGLWESNMAGPNNLVFDINSPPTLNSTCRKLLPIMGFNYEVDRGIHNFGHRAERTLMRVFNQSLSNWAPGFNTGFNRFAMSNKLNPGRAACGDIHLTPQSRSDYDYYTNDYPSVKSNCHEFKNYPLINNEYRDVHCEMWGGCDEIGFFKFWWSNLPRNKGTNFDVYSRKTVLNNWWLYVFEPQRAIR